MKRTIDDARWPRLSRRAVVAGAAALAGVSATRAWSAAGVQSYRAIAYARSRRFQAAVLEPFDRTTAGGRRGPIAPQPPSGLAISMGPQSTNAQREDCQVLSVFTPARTGRRPVVAFLHGGAFATGGGELAWYDGHLLAAEQDIVVVPISYRLGALGFWLPERSAGMSPAYTDVVAALEWIRANIERFGGDPSNVTLVGQSAGCCAAIELTELGFGGRLYRRVVAMSGGALRGTRAEAERRSRAFDALLGTDPRTASVDELRSAYARLPRTSPLTGDGRPFWLPVAAEAPRASNVDVLAGWTRDELAAHALLVQGRTPQRGTDLASFRELGRALREQTVCFARAVAAAGRTAYLYSFDWRGPDTGLGNCHCIDLAFLFGDWQAWRRAPMLRGANLRDYRRMGRRLRAHWAAFARFGRPDVEGAPRWRPVGGAEVSVASLS